MQKEACIYIYIDTMYKEKNIYIYIYMSIECCSKVQNDIDVNKFNPFTIGIFSNLSCILADDDETF